MPRTLREYVYQVTFNSFLWLVVDARTHKPLAGGSTGSEEAALSMIQRAREKIQKADKPKVTRPLNGAVWLIPPRGRPPKKPEHEEP